MCNHVIESIGRWGVNSTDCAKDKTRFCTPRVGDIILVYQDESDKRDLFLCEDKPATKENIDYPFKEKYARIDGVKGDVISLCCQLGSAFLSEDGSVSISGGAFTSINRNDLSAAYTTKAANFWNWGNNLAGAHMGIHYTIERPLFILKNDYFQTRAIS